MQVDCCCVTYTYGLPGVFRNRRYDWLVSCALHKRSDYEIAHWSEYREAAVPADNESREYISAQIAKAGGALREDIGTWFDFLDFDDYVSFGGKA